MELKFMYESCEAKQDKLLKEFSSCNEPKEIYQKIMEMGKLVRHLTPEKMIPENKVTGCQSLMYLESRFENGKVYFDAYCDALLSSGLAQLLIRVYSEETPEAILKCEPRFIKELNLSELISPGRSNGLASLHLKMKQIALVFAMQSPR